MSNSGKFVNHTSFIREAGKTSVIGGESADLSLRQDIYFKPISITPEHIKKYRRSTKEVPGKKQIHFGIFDDSKDYENLVHGVKTKASDHLDQCIKGQNLFGIEHFLNKIKEDNYKRIRREPLGKSLNRDYVFPEAVGKENFKFGFPSIKSTNAKELLYSGNYLVEDKESMLLYSKTHGHSEPGEQKDREYNWPVDKTQWVFGKPQIIERDGCKKSLTTDKLESDYLLTKVIDKRLEDFRQSNNDLIGISRFKGTMRSDLPENFTFGIKTNIVSNAASSLRGNYSVNDLKPELDLGKSVINRSKLKSIQPLNLDKSRSFGVPSIRSDLIRKVVSVSDQTNYGNENDTYDLLYPNPHCFKGLDNPDFETLITKNEVIKNIIFKLKSIVLKKNHEIDDNDFEAIFNECLLRSPNKESKVSFKDFVNVCRNFKREYNKYRHFLPSFV